MVNTAAGAEVTVGEVANEVARQVVVGAAEGGAEGRECQGDLCIRVEAEQEQDS